MKISLIELLNGRNDLEIQEKETTVVIKERPKRGRPSKVVELPKEIKLSEENLEALGLFLAEGTIMKKYNRIELGNTEVLLIETFLRFLENLRISRSEVKVKISAFVDSCPMSEIQLKTFWSNQLKIPIENFQKVSWYHQKGKRKRASPYGVVQIRVYHKLLTEIFYKILKRATKLALTSKSLAMPFLRGIFAGEGSIDKRKDSIHSVIVSCVKYKTLIKKLLSVCGIKPGKYNPRMRGFPIRGIENFGKIYEMQLFKLHPAKDKEFTNRVKNHRYFYRTSSPSVRIP
jgi:hypothetical protein